MAHFPRTPFCWLGVALLVAHAFNLAGAFDPVCWVDSVDGATEVDFTCPAGTTKDDNNPYCYKNCTLMNDKPVAGVTYVTSVQNDDHCIPSCPSNQTLMNSTTTYTNCFTCAAAYQAIPTKGCYSKCLTPNNVSFSDWASAPVCCPPCPASNPFPVKNYPSRCADSKGVYVTRLCKGRTKYNPTANLRLYVMPKEEVAMECPAGSDFYQTRWDGMPEGEYNDGCYTCPAGLITRIYGDSWVYCAPAVCPSAEQKRCGEYCWHPSLLPPTSEPWDEFSCTQFFALFEWCVPKCYPDGYQVAAAVKAAGGTAAVASAASTGTVASAAAATASAGKARSIRPAGHP